MKDGTDDSERLGAPLDWQDLNLFLAVARTGGLTAAGAATGLSAPTLGRRMAAVERAVGRRLFVRGARGYGLTAAGEALRDRALAVEQAVREVERWRGADAGPRLVRISAGAWTSRHVARHAAGLLPADRAWSLEIVTDDARRDIARREVDLGIRNRRPEEPWLAGRRLGTVSFAVYGRAGRFEADPSTPAVALAGLPWIARAEGPGAPPSAQWIDRHHGGAVVLRGSQPRVLLDLVQAGAGVTVLPRFVGDAEPDLDRLGAPIAELDHEQWLVAHHDTRHDPPIRAAIRAVAAVLG